MIVPPLKHKNGTTTEPKRLDGFMLPVLWELQQLAPKPANFNNMPDSAFGPRGLPAYGQRSEIGERAFD